MLGSEKNKLLEFQRRQQIKELEIFDVPIAQNWEKNKLYIYIVYLYGRKLYRNGLYYFNLGLAGLRTW